MSELSVAVVGATGLVGQTALELLETHPAADLEVRAFATERSAGSCVLWREREIPVELLTDQPPNLDFALFCAPNDVAAEFAPAWVRHGVKVIDNSSYFRMHPDVPLVVPEVNREEIRGMLVANPNCSTIQLAVAVAPLHRRWGLKRLSVSTYQSVSGAGHEALQRWHSEIQQKLYFNSPFPRPIHGNVIPWIGEFDEAGTTREERKMMEEIPKILGKAELPVAATCVRVPVAVGHAEAVELQLETMPTLDEIKQLLAASPGIRFNQDPQQLVTPREIAGKPGVYVSRLRISPDRSSILMWVVADNLRKGAAENAIEILTHWRTIT